MLFSISRIRDQFAFIFMLQWNLLYHASRINILIELLTVYIYKYIYVIINITQLFESTQENTATLYAREARPPFYYIIIHLLNFDILLLRSRC